MKFVIYARKSSDESSKNQKASLGDQIKWAEEYCKAKGIEVVETFQESMSAKEIGRPIFNRMIKGFYDGKYQGIITWESSRLSRNSLDEGQIKHLISTHKIHEVHTKDSIYTESELFTLGIFLSLSEQEISTLRKRVVRRMTNMVAEGSVPFMAPYGYRNEKGSVVPREDEQEILQKIFELRVSGLAFNQICDHLNSLGIKSRGRMRDGLMTIGEWKPSAIEHIIKNEFYIGVVKFAGLIGEGIFDRIISRDLWDKANSEKRTNIGYKKHDFPLKGIIKYNGKPLKASLIKGKFVYYHDDQNGIRISQKDIFKKLTHIITQWVFPEEILGEVIQHIRETIKDENRAIYDEIDRIKKLRDTNDSKLSRLLDLYMDQQIERDDYESKKKECLNIRQKLIDESACFDAFDLSLVEKFESLVQLLTNLSETYKNGDDTTKGYILQNALVQLDIDDDKSLTVHEKEPFYWLSLLKNDEWQSRMDTGATSPLMQLMKYLQKTTLKEIRNIGVSKN